MAAPLRATSTIGTFQRFVLNYIWKCTMLPNFQKLDAASFQGCSTELIQSALESTAPGASNGKSDVRIRQLRADLAISEKIALRNNWK